MNCMCDAFQKWNNWLRRSQKPVPSAVVKSPTDREFIAQKIDLDGSDGEANSSSIGG